MPKMSTSRMWIRTLRHVSSTLCDANSWCLFCKPKLHLCKSRESGLRRALRNIVQCDFLVGESYFSPGQSGPADVEGPTAARAPRVDVACQSTAGPNVHGRVVVAHPKLKQYSFRNNHGTTPARECKRPLKKIKFTLAVALVSLHPLRNVLLHRLGRALLW